MTPCFAIDDITTPKGYSLRGLWFGPKKPRRLIIWVHGLSSSTFSMLHVVRELADGKTAVLTFNNRGAEKIIDVRKEGKKAKSLRAGSAHEVFTECVDDIQGAINFARKNGVKKIYLAGHSTGCQKSIYWAYVKKGIGIKGIILLAPVSDYAGALAKYGKNKLEKAAAYARRLVKRGKPDELLPRSVWSEELNDAQRFLSLYTPDSIEEIFSYAQPKKNPRVFKSVSTPILAMLAAEDEFADRPAPELAAWFEKHSRSKRFKSAVIPAVHHGFKGAERKVAKIIKEFIAIE